jgi:hypothetical protein
MPLQASTLSFRIALNDPTHQFILITRDEQFRPPLPAPVLRTGGQIIFFLAQTASARGSPGIFKVCACVPLIRGAAVSGRSMHETAAMAGNFVLELESNSESMRTDLLQMGPAAKST